ncbi:MAG: C40 family peptidase [Acidithiobacillus sp.]|nr:C40 family peptidase [Acidithiobacillus sp.]
MKGHSRYRAHLAPVRTDYHASEASPANFDSLAPSALQLLHLSPVPFAGVGAAPQPSPLPQYSFSRPIPTQVEPVDSAQFINASLVLAKVAADAPVTAVHAIKTGEDSLVQAKPVEADAESAPAHGTLGVALQMLASQAYYWASHPLAVLQENGDFAAGEHAATELRNDVALAAQADAAESADSNWFSARGLVSAALHFIGAPYVWGGVSPRTGFDCSGFVKYILAKFDIHVPRTSYAQAASLPAIPRRDLKPGDLVFFNTMHRAFSHVGIYIGGGRFVSAQTPATGVQVASLSDPYWAARFDGARRLPHGINIS